jgi:hypothetical protein
MGGGIRLTKFFNVYLLHKKKIMKLIKINTDHYVIVDDSEIEVDDWYIDDAKQIRQSVVSDEVYWQHRPYNREYMKITHSTKPIEYIKNGMTALSVEEVKELIGEVDVEKKVQSLKNNFGYSTDDYYQGAEDGYNQSLEDNKEKKYTEEDLRKAFFGGGDFKDIEQFDFFIKSLQPKTEWEVKVVDGKLKLKD